MPKVAVMITSCDAYEDCWRPMVFSLDKYWPDCEWPRYIVTNFKEDDGVPNTTFIKVGDDQRSWCTSTQKALKLIDADYVVFLMEDYWLSQKVDNNAIKRHVDYMANNNVDYLKIQYDILRDEHRIGKTDYCLNPVDMRYALNTAISIWRCSSMIDVLPDGWSGWEWEREIMPYVKKNNIHINSQTLYSPLYATKGMEVIRGEAIIRGIWTPTAVEFMKTNGFEYLVNKRPIMGPFNRWLRYHMPGHQSVFRWPFWGIIHFLNKYNKLTW